MDQLSSHTHVMKRFYLMETMQQVLIRNHCLLYTPKQPEHLRLFRLLASGLQERLGS